jgi:hypothetical protein
MTGEYRAARSKNPHAIAYTEAINAIIDNPENKLDDFDTSLLRVIGGLGSYIEADKESKALDEKFSKSHISEYEYDRRKELKTEYLIPFNHNLKTLITFAPSGISMDHLTVALTNTHTAVFSGHNVLHHSLTKAPSDVQEPSAVLYKLNQATNAMRHEVAVETMLDAARIEYDYDVSIEEDFNGIDIIVYIDGSREGLDIKSSFAAETRAYDAHANDVHSCRAIWTGLEDADFTGMRGDTRNALTISYDVAKQKAALFVQSARLVIRAAQKKEAAHPKTTAIRTIGNR